MIVIDNVFGKGFQYTDTGTRSTGMPEHDEEGSSETGQFLTLSQEFPAFGTTEAR